MNKIFNLFFVACLGLIGCATAAMNKAAPLNLAILYNDNVDSVFSFEPCLWPDPVTLNVVGGLLEAQQVPIVPRGFSKSWACPA